MKDQLIYLPPRVRFFLLTSLGVLSLALFGFAAYTLTLHPTGAENVVAAALGLAQATGAGLGFLIILAYSRLSMGVEDITKRSNHFFEVELPQAFLLTDFRRSGYADIATHRLEDMTNVSIKIDFVKDSHIAKYLISSSDRNLELFVLLNVKRIVVGYFLDPNWKSNTDVLDCFEYVISGAEHSGYNTEWMVIGEGQEKRLEFRAMTTVDETFLVNPLDRKYWCTDIAIMTRSVLSATRNVSLRLREAA